jgi:hypothetical protein
MRKIWKALIRSMEQSGQRRAEIELRRMGYTPEKIDEIVNKNLKGWV